MWYDCIVANAAPEIYDGIIMGAAEWSVYDKEIFIIAADCDFGVFSYGMCGHEGGYADGADH